MADTLILLQLEHRTFARLLAILDAQCDELDAGQPPDRVLLRQVMDYMRDYPDACHHPKEDVAFRHLRVRAPTAATALADFLGDHEALHDVTVQTAELVAQAGQNGRLPAPRLSSALRRFTDIYRRHLEAEDAYFFPALSTHLKRDDWEVIDFEMFDQPDPLYDESTENRFLKLRELIWEMGEHPEANPDE